MNQWVLLSRIVEELMAVDFEVVLGLHEHRCDHFTNGSVKELLRQINNVLWNSLSKQEVRTLVCEVVAIVLEDIVCLLSEARTHIFKELHKELLRQLCEA
jgi:hypothetical protein